MKTVLIILFLAVGTTFGFPPWFQVCRVDTDCILVKDLGRIGKCIQGECITDYLDRFQAKPRGFLPECIYDKDCPRKEQKCFANHCGFADDSKRRRLSMCNPDLNGDCTFGRKNFQVKPRGFLPECIYDKDCPRKEQKCFANHCGFADDSKRRRLSMCNLAENGECTCAQDSDCPAGGWCNNQGVCLGWEEFAAGGL